MIAIGITIEYFAFEVYSISIPAPIPIANPSFHVIVIIAGLLLNLLDI
jgi:hypothetical protein